MEKAFVVNMFNLADRPRTISGEFDLRKAGLAAEAYRGSKPWGRVQAGIMRVKLEMPPWSAQVADFHAAVDAADHSSPSAKWGQ